MKKKQATSARQSKPLPPPSETRETAEKLLREADLLGRLLQKQPEMESDSGQRAQGEIAKFERNLSDFLERIRESDTEVNQFAIIVRRYLKDVGWSNANLAASLGVSDSALSTWIGERIRLPSKADVARIAWVLAGAQDGTLQNHAPNRIVVADPDPSSKRTGVAHLPFILNELLAAAGYATIEGKGENRVWERLSGTSQSTVSQIGTDRTAELRVGWVETQPLLKQITRINWDDSPVGLAASITRYLAAYLGVRLKWVRLNWSALGRSLREGAIDVVAPMAVHFPKRAIDMRFTHGLPGLHCGLNCILNNDEYATITKLPAECKGLEDISVSDIVMEFTPGNIGAWGGALFAPDNPVEEREIKRLSQPAIGTSPASSSFGPDAFIDHDWTDVISHPRELTGTRRVRCYLTGQLICHNAVNYHPAATTLIPLANSPSKLPYAFGVAHTEPRLYEMINETLRLMFSDGPLMTQIYRTFIGDLVYLAQGSIVKSADPSYEWFKPIADDVQERLKKELQHQVRKSTFHP